MIAVIDYGTGNIESVENALGRLGAEYTVTASPEVILGAERVILPGVGEAAMAMAMLRERGLVDVIRAIERPALGICIGMQLMCAHSEEGDVDCIGIFDSRVEKFRPGRGIKIPHMGWNDIYDLRTPLFRGIEENSYVYYVHSFAAGKGEHTVAVTDYGGEFSGALARDNFYGVQFHPEKSSMVGEMILKNFLEL